MRGTFLIGFAVCAFGVGAWSEAGVIVSYRSENTDEGVAADAVALGVAPLPLTRGPGVARGSGGTFNTRDWSIGNAIDADDYLQWGWSNAEPTWSGSSCATIDR
jgi:hypothetical protein